MKRFNQTKLRRRAIRILQDREHPIYIFALTGEEIVRLADISRISRDEEGRLIGYQRPEVKRHIQNIVDYLNGDRVIFPNAIILALSSGVNFKQTRGPAVGESGFAVTGTIEIPLPTDSQPKPAWIVDGQQRTYALAHSQKSNFPVPVTAFIADNVDLQRDQFLRINSAKPLPRGLIDELLPTVSTTLPANLAARKVPSAVCDILNNDPASPFHKLIRRSSDQRVKSPSAVITDTVVVQMLYESFTKPSGILFAYRNLATGYTDFPRIIKLLIAYWTAVKETFPDAWGLRPEKSRLMHGVGIRSMGCLMDRVMSSIDPEHPQASQLAKSELQRISSRCKWTSGVWEDLGGIRWNELQNVPSHIRSVTNFLVRAYTDSRSRY